MAEKSDCKLFIMCLNAPIFKKICSISIMENIKQKNLNTIYKILSNQNLEYFTNDLDQIIVPIKDDTVVIVVNQLHHLPFLH